MRTLATLVSVGALLLAAGCGDGTTSPEPEAPAAQWVMPNLVGTGLQAAQDAIQELTGIDTFLTESHDLTGEDRQQVMDDNWQVCTQNIAPGGALTADSLVDFGVVKADETCP